MQIRKILPLALVTAAVLLVSFGTLSRSSAQQTPVIDKVTYEQADVRIALRELFKKTQSSYSIAPDVQGTVTLDLRNISFEVALQNVLRQVDATYRIENGIYNIVKRETTTPGILIQEPNPLPMTLRPSLEPLPTSMTQDNRYLYVLTGSVLRKIQKSDLKVVATRDLTTSHP